LYNGGASLDLPVPSRRLLVSPSNAARLEVAAELFRSWADGSETLLVAETRGAADDFLRAAIAGNGFLGVHRFTPGQLAAAVAAEPVAAHRLAPVSRLGLEAIAARCLYACHAAGGLAYFAPVASAPGLPRALASTLSELRLQGVAPGMLASAGAPGRDLRRLLQLYEDELARRSLADAATLLALAAPAVRNSHFGGLPLILLDIHLDSAALRDFLAAVVAESPRAAATAAAGDAATLAALRAVLGVEPEYLDAPADPAALQRLRRYVFSPDAPGGGSGTDASLEFFSASGEGLEAVEIARRIRLLAAEGTPFDRVAVLLRKPDAYLPLLEDAFRRAGIPGYFTRSTARPDPAGRAFLALLACASEGLSASRFAEYLSLGQVPVAEFPRDWVAPEDELLAGLKAPPAAATEAPPDAPENQDAPVLAGTLQTPVAWEKLLVDAAVIGGQDRWERRLRGLEAEYRLRLQEMDSEGDPRRRHLERDLERLRHLQRFSLPLVGFLASSPTGASWSAWLTWLFGLAARSLRQPDSVLAVLSELQPMEEIGPVTLGEVRAVLHERLSFLRREPAGRRYSQVFVGSIPDARGRSFEVVFLPGLAEGLFPQKASEDPLLLDVHRAALNAGLPQKDDRVAEERLLLREAIGAARARFVASYPRMDVSLGRPRVPSFYALEIWRAALGRLPGLREIEARAAGASATQLGWPAPAEPRIAIDDAEYDLAFIGRLLRERRQKERGAGRYLLTVNSHLARALRARRSRWQVRDWTPSDGLVAADPAALEALQSQSLRARSYSPTTLQQYAACPYRFFLHGIQRLRPRDEIAGLEQLDPLTRGALFHEAQWELFRELERDGLLPVSAWQLPQILDRADQALDRVSQRYEEELAPAIPRVWESGLEEIRTDLRGWVHELVTLHADWRPALFEFAFGLAGEGRDPRSTREPAAILDGVLLRGAIDLVEKHPTRAVLRVTDHKTGKPPEREPQWTGQGEILQPLLYGLAAEALLQQPVESGLLFYATQRGNYRRVEIPLTPQARARAAQVLQTIDAAVTEGFLPAAPRAEACAYCDYQAVCGPYEERRVRFKKPDRLDPLYALRSVP
jgi:ATP-dependent helicase/nuclease subunit B